MPDDYQEWYEMLRDAIVEHLDPHDGDEAEVDILCRAVESAGQMSDFERRVRDWLKRFNADEVARPSPWALVLDDEDDVEVSAPLKLWKELAALAHEATEEPADQESEP